MFLGLREHEMRSNPCIIGGKIPFDPNIIIIVMQSTFMYGDVCVSGQVCFERGRELGKEWMVMGYQVLKRQEAIAQAAETFQTDGNIRVMGPGALRNNIRVKHVTLPDVYSVEMQAFYNCTSLRSVSFPKLRSVKREAFSGCSHLKEVVLPRSVNHVEKAVFCDCRRMEQALFDKRVSCRELPDEFFSGCRGLRRVALPSGVVVIGRRAFYKCESLERIKLPDGLRKIGIEAFYQCGLTSLKLPEHLEIISDSAFLKCKRLEYVKVPPSVNVIGKWAFHGCTRLQVLEIGHDPQEVGEWLTNKNCIIRCHKGSRMEAYARTYGIQVEYL